MGKSIKDHISLYEKLSLKHSLSVRHKIILLEYRAICAEQPRRKLRARR